jgi:hypothetical protein
MGPIDSAMGIIKQAVYLLVVGSVIGGELLAYAGKFKPTGFIAKLWRYEEEVVHFLLGSLLSECTLFFIKSSSLASSFMFLGLLVAIILVNEFKRFQGGSGVAVRTGLLAICCFAFFGYLIPLALGFVGIFPFLLALVAAAGAAYPLWRWLRKRAGEENQQLVHRQFAMPYGCTLALILVLYMARLIPPVPLSVEFMGVYHEVKKEKGQYLLGFDPRGKSIFQNGEKVFYLRAGDRPYGFARVFSPSRFSDRVQMRWMYKDPRKGWTTTDVIPMAIAGGRVEGFRGFSFKSHVEPGEWQIRVETTDSREMGRLSFSIENDPNQEPRQLEYEAQ